MHRTIRFAALVLCFCTAARADLDLDNDDLGDVWEAKYRPAELLPGNDDDGDGRSNREESEAGTDPLQASDVFSVSDITLLGGQVELRWPSQAGKVYQLQTTADPGDEASWQILPGVHPGTGDELAATTAAPVQSPSFFRVVVADTDTDGDGLTDWEELQTGHDPAMNHVHMGMGDLQHLTMELQAEPVITISAPDNDATEPASSPAANSGMFRIQRTGGIGRVVVSLAQSGSAGPADHEALPDSVEIPLASTGADVPLIPSPDALLEADEVVVLEVGSSATYAKGAADSAGVLIHDHVQANGTGLTANYWKHPDNTRDQPVFTGTPDISRIDPVVDFDSDLTPWPGAPVTTTLPYTDYYSSRWEGELLPEFSQVYTIYGRTDSAGRVWINGQLLIDNWPASRESSAIIALDAGKRYPVVFEHYNNTGRSRATLSWKSASLEKEVIPQARLFPDTPPRILGPFEAWAFVGAPGFSYRIEASGSPTLFSAVNLPPGLALDPVSGVISGDPVTPGQWQVALTATNTHGSGSAFLDLTVIETSGSITRELWTGVAGSEVADIPLDTAPASTTPLGSLECPADTGDDYGARIRGFLTAPATGEYRFFLRADEAAEFHLSDDDEPVNSWLRAATTVATGSGDWSDAVPSALLHLEAGRRYFLEILHKESSGSDHLALAWAKPGDPDDSPSEIIPGYLLTRYEDVALGSSPDGTLYFTALTPQTGAVTNAYGSCTLRLSSDKTTAWVTPTFGNLGSPFQGMHVHDTRLPSSSNIVFDLDEPGVEHLADGSYVWEIQDVGGLTAQEIADGLAQFAYLNVHTVNYPSGEIKGFFRALDGSATFTPPPPPPEWTGEPATSNSAPKAAARFLQQATFGANPDDIASLQSMASYEDWIDDQIALPVSEHLPYVESHRNVTNPNNSEFSGSQTFNSWWRTSVQADDQLRQRVAFALSQIMVVSESGPLDNRASALSGFYDTLLAHAFGNARDLLEAVTLHPAMGRYLDMLRNDKPDLTKGRIPNENYAREILQLFSLGLYRFHPDGSLILNSKGVPIPVYDQDAVIGLAHVFTGWDYQYDGDYKTSFSGSSNWTEPMREVPARHFTGRKRILNNVVLPGLPELNGVPLDPYASHSSSTISGEPVFQALAREELEAVHDQIFNHPNLGPLLCRQLIQRLVTSTPSRGYIHRVVGKFNDNGSGIRGDLAAVVKAILLDYEARSNVAASAPGYGKLREPLLRVTQLARAFRPENNFGGTYVQDGGLITVDSSPTVHRLTGSQKVLLGFSGAGTPATDGDYALSTTYPPTDTSFTVRTQDTYRCSWAQSGTTITVTTPGSHTFSPGEPVYLRYRSGGGGVLVDGVQTIDSEPASNTFTVTAPDSAERSGDCDASYLSGSYRQDSDGVDTANTILTITSGTVTGLGVGGEVEIRFTPKIGQTSTPDDGIYTIVAVDAVDARKYTLEPVSGTLSLDDNLDGTFRAAALSPVLDRSGDVVSGYSDWNVGNTDTDLGQTPLGSPTVFNFFEPDYQFPGTLAANGLTTPEFQISSDTNVIRQANYLFGGIYSTGSTTSLTSGYTNGFSSFKRGGHDIMMDFAPWMDLRPGGSGYWTDDANLRDLIRELSALLMAGQMSSAMEDEIYNFTSNTANISYSTASDSQRRNRVRAVIYFIAVSPESAIQR
ncbi:DUF1800 family protein [Luteolibacter marinus]|uniref:DUF1800 family protein n=1 Tax=Luteolibacter marinus TaxID=2776705 RepID=UPI0018672588|nr:DUF1800 family protein [Luteolibacter marinus]